MTRFRFELLLYALIASGSAAVSNSGPVDWRFVVGVIVAGAVAVKAKISPSKQESAPSKPDGGE